MLKTRPKKKPNPAPNRPRLDSRPPSPSSNDTKSCAHQMHMRFLFGQNIRKHQPISDPRLVHESKPRLPEHCRDRSAARDLASLKTKRRRSPAALSRTKSTFRQIRVRVLPSVANVISLVPEKHSTGQKRLVGGSGRAMCFFPSPWKFQRLWSWFHCGGTVTSPRAPAA